MRKPLPRPPGGNFQTPPLPRTAAFPRKRKGGFCFMFTIVFLLTFIYSGYTGVILVPMLYPKPMPMAITLASVFHFLFFMIVLAYIQCVRTDPGRIPKHWAFYRGDVAKRKRYCKECNAWKPDRTHHCSACSRCVLNMDHHCPWINNCVGFQNRKFFMQLLIYGVLGLGFVFFHGLGHICYLLWTHFFSYSGMGHIRDVFLLTTTVVLTALSGFLFMAMAQFAAFHIRLIASNLTTIENLDYNARESAKYDLGASRNCQQVLGRNILFWWLPFHTSSSAPAGDGVRWSIPAQSEI